MSYMFPILQNRRYTRILGCPNGACTTAGIYSAIAGQAAGKKAPDRTEASASMRHITEICLDEHSSKLPDDAQATALRSSAVQALKLVNAATHAIASALWSRRATACSRTSSAAVRRTCAPACGLHSCSVLRKAHVLGAGLVDVAQCHIPGDGELHLERIGAWQKTG